MLNCNLGGAASLRELIGVALHVPILPPREASSPLRQWTTWLSFDSSLAVAFIVGAEGSVAADRAGLFAVPGRISSKAARAATEGRAQAHVPKTVDDIVGAVIALIKAIAWRSHQSWRGRLRAVSAKVLEASNVVGKCRWKASSRRDRRWCVGAQIRKGLR